MNERAVDDRPMGGAERRCVLVWIDAEEAVIVRWNDGEASLERLESDVPGRRRSTGHVRHDPRVRHGGGGTPQSAGEPRRLEHLRQFVDEVAGRVGPAEDLMILGTGTVRKRLERLVRAADERRQVVRAITNEAAARLTDPQLVAHLRHALGDDPPRRAIRD